MAPVHADVSARIEDRRSGVTENPVSGKPPQNFWATAANIGPAPGDVGDSAGKVTRQAGKPLVPPRPWLTAERIRIGKSTAAGRSGACRPGSSESLQADGAPTHRGPCVSIHNVGESGGKGRGPRVRDRDVNRRCQGRQNICARWPPFPVTSRSSGPRLRGVSSDCIVLVSRSRRGCPRGRRSRHGRQCRRYPPTVRSASAASSAGSAISAVANEAGVAASRTRTTGTTCTAVSKVCAAGATGPALPAIAQISPLLAAAPP